MIQSKKVLGTLGLAMKAGEVASGEFLTEKAIRDGEAYLVIVAEDALPIRKRSFQIRVSFIKLPMLNLETKIRWERRSEKNSVRLLQC